MSELYTSIFSNEDLTVKPCQFITSEKQALFDNLLKEEKNNKRRIILPLDDDTDGWSCVRILLDTLKLILPNHSLDVYITPQKSHHTDRNFIHYVLTTSQERPLVIITDSSTQDIPVLRELSEIADIWHIDHHITNEHYEEQLNEICNFHANCRTEPDKDFHDMSAGMYTSLFITNYMRSYYNDKELIQQVLTLGVMSFIADCCPTLTPYHKSLLQWFEDTNYLHPVIEAFKNKYSRQDLYFVAFTVSPKLNMMFRLRLLEEIRNSLFLNYEELYQFIKDLNQMYKNYRSYIIPMLNEVQIIEYPNLAYADLTGLDYYYKLFKGKLHNFTGWFANTLSERLAKPTITVCEVSELEVKGSIRSISQDNVYALMEGLDYINYGGHPSAVGFTLSPENVELFIYEFYNRYSVNKLKNKTEYVKLNHLFELIDLYKSTLLNQYAFYNKFTLNEAKGFVYDLCAYDMLDYKTKHVEIDLATKGLKMISFDRTISQGDSIVIIPRFSKYGIDLQFHKNTKGDL